jgi:transposase
MMASVTKRRFTDEFKREAVALWETSGRMQTEVAAELGIMPAMLRRWQRKLQESSAPPVGPAAKPPVSAMTSPADQASEIARLRRELDRARMERDILKKGVRIFAEIPSSWLQRRGSMYRRSATLTSTCAARSLPPSCGSASPTR